MAKPVVSVIIPTYNYGRFLREAVDSVLAQGVEDLEVLIIDDGSTDETPAVVAELTDPRVRSIRVPNGGVARARNLGLQMARGAYVAFLDADDRWRSGKLRRQLRILANEPGVGFVFTDFVRFDAAQFLPSQFSFVPDVRSLPSRPCNIGDGRLILDDAFTALAPLPLFATWVQTVVLRAETVRGIEFPTRYYGAQVEDAGYMLRVYRRTVAAYIDEPLVEVRRHGQNSYTDAAQIREPEIRMVEHLLTEELAPRHRSLLKRKLGRLYVVHGSHAKSSRDYHLALRSYISALRLPGVRVRALAHLLTIPIVALLRGMRLARTWLLTRLSRTTRPA